MRSRALIAGVLCLSAAAGLVGARPTAAEVAASGTQLRVGSGPSRFYMTYGHAEDPELYAPIIGQLGQAGISFSRRGDSYVVRHRGAYIGTWPIVTSRDEVPETGEHPVVLVLGINAFVPVRKLSELCALDVRWEKRNNMVALVPSVNRRPRVAKEPGSQAPAAAETVRLTGLEVEAHGDRLEVRVRATGPVRPQWLSVKQLPLRLVVDFPNARWADGVPVPAAVGVARSVRIGHPQPSTARVVFEVPSLNVKVTNFSLKQNEVVATVGYGAGAPNPSPLPSVIPTSPAQNARIAAIRRRGGPTQLSSRQAAPGSFPSLGGIDRRRAPLVDPSARLTGKVIVVDPGHGGHHRGASGLFSYEKDLCLKMGLQLRRELEERGATVVITRETDAFVSLDQRCAIANRANADIFISIHCNSTGRRNSATGTETYWRHARSRRLAETLHPYLVSAVGKMDRGVRNESFAVIRETNMPSVLLEVGYINNAEEELLLASPEFHKRVAESVSQGVLRYFGADTLAAND